jgi:CcmD family protein
MNFLYAAYAATWIIHIGYLWTVARRYSRLRDKMAEFKKRP